MKKLHAVTGAFGFAGKYIARRLLDQGREVITLTDSLHRENEFGDRIRVFPFRFDNTQLLEHSLRGVKVLYNTYWIRMNDSPDPHAVALANTQVLLRAAKHAGVERVVQISIMNPSAESPLPYFRNKALAEEELRTSGMSYAILRPSFLFGKEDILINNLAWALRQFPVIGIFGMGEYRIQPIHVDDLARIALDEGERLDDVTLNIPGPETFPYRKLIQTIGQSIGKNRFILPLPPFVVLFAGALIGRIVGDIMITKDEMTGIMQNLLCVQASPAGTIKLSQWLVENRETIGLRYASDLARRKNRQVAYEKL